LATLNARPPLAITPTSTRDDGTRARLAAVVRSSADAIVGETLEGIVTDWNPAAERLYGYRAEEVIGRHLTMLIPPERLAEAEEILRWSALENMWPTSRPCAGPRMGSDAMSA
jgi:PAS domain-containing protein